jgi:hypothetical protein
MASGEDKTAPTADEEEFFDLDPNDEGERS